jgi:hypothetical protein
MSSHLHDLHLITRDCGVVSVYDLWGNHLFFLTQLSTGLLLPIEQRIFMNRCTHSQSFYCGVGADEKRDHQRSILSIVPSALFCFGCGQGRCQICPCPFWVNCAADQRLDRHCAEIADFAMRVVGALSNPFARVRRTSESRRKADNMTGRIGLEN